MNKDIERSIKSKIVEKLFTPKKVVILYGPRQVGKTTLSKEILTDFDSADGYFNCEEFEVRDALNSHSSKTMNTFFGGHKVIVLDEAQTIPDVGKAIKIFIDAYPDTNIIATGSSSFELANKLSEPLTGRKYEFFLYPISIQEIVKNKGGNRAIIETLNQRLVYGSYPDVVKAKNEQESREVLSSLASSYLYRDVMAYNNIKNSDTLTAILRALAYQVGSEVSYNEIADLVKVDQKTVASYIDLLEQAFIIFRLGSYSRNLRNEIKKKKKFYFYDNGILNSIINDFNGPETMRDMGGLWENLMMVERRKYNQMESRQVLSYFWRLKAGGEINLIEDENAHLSPFEFKWRQDKISANAYKFIEEYKNSDSLEVINKDNFLEFVIS
jgi:predicted AAA+ superfamily ATPase